MPCIKSSSSVTSSTWASIITCRGGRSACKMYSSIRMNRFRRIDHHDRFVRAPVIFFTHLRDVGVADRRQQPLHRRVEYVGAGKIQWEQTYFSRLIGKPVAGIDENQPVFFSRLQIAHLQHASQRFFRRESFDVCRDRSYHIGRNQICSSDIREPAFRRRFARRRRSR